MGLNNLEDFLRRQKESMNEYKDSVEKIKSQWVCEVERFYRIIESFLTPIQEKDLLIFEYETINKHEQHIGEYSTKKLQIYFPTQKVVIEPIGKDIIGAHGRIDMIGSDGNIRFLLVNSNANKPKSVVDYGDGVLEAINKVREEKEVEYVWKIATPAPKINFIQLNEDSFSDALLGVMGE